MMKRQTVEQLLKVFGAFRERVATGRPLRKAYQEAVREVADQYNVAYQTIGDGCRRRLKLNDIGELYALLERWVEGDPKPLAQQIRAASESSAHDHVTAFFESAASSAARHSGQVGPSVLDGKADTFSLRLPKQDARKVRALAEMEGTSPGELLGRLLGRAVTEEMKRMAHVILQDSVGVRGPAMGREEILRALQDHEAELRGLGAERLSLFGSAARGDSGPLSDVDLAVELKPEFSKGGLDYFGRFEALRTRLSEILGWPVDLVEEPVEKPQLRERINEDRARAF